MSTTLIQYASRRRVALFAALLLALLMGMGSMAPAAAADKAPPAAADKASNAAAGPAAVTTQDPEITLDDLDLMLEPMTKDETDTEAKAWFALLRSKAHEISVAELAVRRKNREIAQLEKVKAAATEVAKATEEIKSKDAGGAPSSDKDKSAATEHLAEAQKALEKNLNTASKEAEKETAKVAAASAASSVAPAPAAPAPGAAAPVQAVAAAGAAPAVSAPVASDQEIMQRAVETAAKKSEKTGDAAEVAKTAGAAQKEVETSVTNEVKSLAQEAPAATEKAVDSGHAGTPSAAAVADTSKKVENLASKAGEATEAKTDVKVQLIGYSTELTNQRTALTDRLKLVLDKLDLKGGDSKEYRAYLASIGGVKIDVSDQAATVARIKGWALSDEGGLRLARDVATFLGYILGSIVVAWIVRTVMRRVMRAARGTSHLLQDFIIDMSGRAIVLLGVLLGLSALEINLAPILAVIGAAGFVVAFALQGTLSNLASGLLLMVNKPFDVGDTVEAGGAQGKVTGMTIFATTILTDDGMKKIVPNNTIWNGVIVNKTTGVINNPTAAEAKPSPQQVEAKVEAKPALKA